MKNNNNESTTQSKKFNNNTSLTLMLMLIAGFLIFWFLVAGSLTENRFGTHILFNGDMISSPLWYTLSITYISILFMIGAMVLLSLELRGKFKLNISQEKLIRIVSYLIIGISGFMVGISAISFATFQTQFFKSQLFHAHKFGKLSVSDQGLSIGSISIILIVGAMATMTFFLFSKKEFNDKLYFTLRNVSIASVAAGWFIFNMNINAFGAMGGDLNTLSKGLLGFDFGSADFAEWSQMDAKTFWTDVLGQSGGPLVWGIAKKWFEPIWIGGLVPGFDKFGIHWDPFTVPDGGLQKFFEVQGPLLNQLDKPSFIFGTNNSIQAMLLFTGTMSLIVALPTYGVASYYMVEDNSKSITYDFSIFVIVAVTALYGILAWINPYILLNHDEYATTLLDAWSHGTYNTLAPGLIAGAGMHGGIHSALVYYFPLYKGTILWWISFSLMFVIPVVAISNAIYINGSKEGLISKKIKSIKSKTSSKKVEETETEND